MTLPAWLRFVGTCLAYLGIGIGFGWVALQIRDAYGFWPSGDPIEALTSVPPHYWLLVPIAAIPGAVVYYTGDMIEARDAGISLRALHIRRRLGIKAKPDEP